MDNIEKNEQTAEETPVRTKEITMPELLTVSPSPHIRNPENIASIMLDVIIALVPAMFWGVYVFGCCLLYTSPSPRD